MCPNQANTLLNLKQVLSWCVNISVSELQSVCDIEMTPFV